MSTRVLRRKPRIDYYESEKPGFDEYIYCEKCVEYVFEYCAIHGPLLVVPDNKVPSKSNCTSRVPRAALTIPQVLHLAPSIIPGAGIGVFATITLPRGIRFGPYIGVRTDSVSSEYCWQIYDHNNKRSHVIDAVDPELSNWMRYTNCSRHWTEQNLIAYQYKGHLYYRTIKMIPRFTELLVFYGSESAISLQVNLSKYNNILHDNQFIYTPKRPTDNLQTSNDSNIIRLHCDENVIQKVCNSDELFTDFQIIDKSNIENSQGYNKDNSEQKFQCDKCKKMFLSKRNLNRHLLSHLPTQKYQCPNCSYGTSIRYRFRSHVLIHSNQEFLCDHCNKSFATERYLKRHLLSHLPKPKYQCMSCTFGTSERYSFKRHALVHSKDTIIGNFDQTFQ